MPSQMDTATSATWFSSVMSTKTQTESETMLMQSFLSGHQTELSPVLPSSSSSSTVTSTPEDEKSVQPPFPPDIDKTNPDWSLPVSKFLEGFRVQAAASLSNAYL